PEERRADAADNYSQIKPFAVVSTALHQNNTYVEAMAKKRVLNFGSLLSRPQSVFSAFPKMVWGFYPSVEIQAEQFSTYVCTKVKPYPVSFAGVSAPPINKGEPRVYGMWSSGDKRQPELALLANLVKKRVADCGVTIVVAKTFPSAGYIQDNRYTGKQANEAVAEFRNKNVTTILWPGGLETTFSKQAGAQGYRPEIVVWGDRIFETDFGAGFQEQTVWAQARMITNVTYIPRLEDEPCYIAFKETDPAGDTSEIDHQACPIFEDIRQLFVGIQVAGPRLGPTSIDKGFRAIPKRKSTNFAVPACFYEPGDYTCEKDAMAERWDPSAAGGQGCYRVTQGGTRYLRGDWPTGDVLAQDKPDDPCNTYSNHNLTNPNAPNPLGED
ncbi:MAG TPA: hypothetical protein VMY34_03065, partial [Acidimicrobiales bacterium]|nr:hypothetical protein [Acidimicrobiales bacterium]